MDSQEKKPASGVRLTVTRLDTSDQGRGYNQPCLVLDEHLRGAREQGS